MAKPTIVTRAGKGSALTWTEGDTNLTNLRDATITVKAGTGGTDVISDLNGTVTLVAGTNITISGDNTAKTVTINSSGGSGITDVIQDTTPQLGGNLDTNGYAITSASNADVTIEPNGTGDIYLKTDIVYIGETAANVALTAVNNVNSSLLFNSDGSVSLLQGGTSAALNLGDNLSSQSVQMISGSGGISFNTTSGNITFTNDNAAVNNLVINGGANGDITVEPNGTGNVNLNADTVRVGDSAAAATITTNGAGNLVLNTNAGTNSGNITINQGANANIQLTPNGTGSVILSGPSVAAATPSTSGTPGILTRNTTTTANSIRWPSISVQKHRSDLALASMTNEPAVIAYSVRDSANTNRIFGSHRCVYQGASTNPYFAFDMSTDGFTTTVNAVSFGGGQATWGNSTGNYTHTTIGTGSLILNTNQGTNTGNITLVNGANNNITITPDGTGKAVVTNLAYNEAVYTAGSTTGTITPNCANGPIQSITLTGSITFNAFTSPISGQTLTLVITQPSSGGPYTLTSTMLFAGGSKTLSTAANAVDILTVSYIGTTYYATLSKGYA